MSESRVNVEGLKFQVTTPERLDMDQWGAAQELLRREFAKTLDIPKGDLDDMLYWGDLKTFQAARIDPRIDMENGRLRPNQSFSSPLAVTAMDGDTLVGYLYSANNTSGSSEFKRGIKRIFIVKNYNWLREFAVDSEYQRRGIWSVMAALMLKARMVGQPTSAYVWEETSLVEKLTSSFGFEKIDEPVERKLGKSVVHEQTLRAKTGQFSEKLKDRPGVEEALANLYS